MKKSTRIITFLTIITLISCKGEPSNNSSNKVDNESSIINISSTEELSSYQSLSTNIDNSIISISSDDVNDLPNFALTGFAYDYISNRSETQLGYVVVNDELEFITAIANSNTKVIELVNDLDLGYLEVNDMALYKNFDLSSYSNIFLAAEAPKTHPKLLQTGVGRINIQDRNSAKGKKSLMIYSKNGNTIRHCKFVIKRSEDIVIRNIKFDELWEWDEYSKGNYDKNDWDYITIEECNGVYLDHLTFAKSYDGIVDLKKGSKNVTISWSKFSYENNEFIRHQFDYLEENKDNYPMYSYIRSIGFTKEDIIKLNIPQIKGHLVGATSLDATNNELSITLHHNYYKNLQDRLPRLRAGNAHVYNCILDSSQAHDYRLEMQSKYESELIQAASKGYKIDITLQGIVTTENGAVLMENSIFKGVTSPIKNNQQNPSLVEYTGKYQVVNSIYELKSYYFIGGSDDINTPFISNQAPIIDFSFNGFTSLPYNYSLDEVEEIETILNDSYIGSSNLDIDWLNIRSE